MFFRVLKFLGALGFLTRIRVPDRALALPLNSTAHFFPLVGVIVGGISAVTFLVCNQFLPVPISVWLSMIATILVTGGFHEDGLADSADGLGGGWTKSDVLRIMQDSRVGSYGAIALVVTLALKAQALSSIPDNKIVSTMIVAHAVSRFYAISITYTHDYVRFEGKSKPISDGMSTSQFLFALITASLTLLLLPWQACLIAVISTLIARQYLVYRMKIRIGGYTGDLLGATQQITEVMIYLSVCAWTLY
jgi:adenosylcobinamide-GDP ribazoletransferase